MGQSEEGRVTEVSSRKNNSRSHSRTRRRRQNERCDEAFWSSSLHCGDYGGMSVRNKGRRLRTRVRQQQASISGGSRTRSSEAKQDKVDGIRAQLMKVNIEF